MSQIKRSMSEIEEVVSKRGRSTGRKKAKIVLKRRELKMFPTSLAMNTVANTIGTQCLTDITQGDDYINREGRKISPVGLIFREAFVPGDANPNVNFRRIIFIDWGYTGNAHGYADVLYTAHPMSVKSYQQTERITILKDDFISLSNYLGASGTRGALYNDLYFDLSKEYNQANRDSIQFIGSGPGTYNVGSIFVMIICDKSISYSSNTNTGYQFFSGVTFTDS